MEHSFHINHLPNVVNPKAQQPDYGSTASPHYVRKRQSTARREEMYGAKHQHAQSAWFGRHSLALNLHFVRSL